MTQEPRNNKDIDQQVAEMLAAKRKLGLETEADDPKPTRQAATPAPLAVAASKAKAAGSMVLNGALGCAGTVLGIGLILLALLFGGYWLMTGDLPFSGTVKAEVIDRPHKTIPNCRISGQRIHMQLDASGHTVRYFCGE